VGIHVEVLAAVESFGSLDSVNFPSTDHPGFWEMAEYSQQTHIVQTGRINGFSHGSQLGLDLSGTVTG
jgi:hypothetical protein